MAAPTVAVFDGWLSKRLLKINPDVDLEVFVSYIRSIVESEDDVEEATEALNGILAEIVVRLRVNDGFFTDFVSSFFLFQHGNNTFLAPLRGFIPPSHIIYL